MAIIWLELHTDCPRCLAVLPINLVANAIPCPHCGAKVALAPDVALAQVVSGREGQVGMFGNAGGIGGRFGPADAVACARCDAVVDPFTATPDGALRCERCKTPMSIRVVPPELAEKVPVAITHIVAEARAAALTDGGQAPRSQRFYLWRDPLAEARAEVERVRRGRAAGAMWLITGLVLLGSGAAFYLWRGAGLWRALALPGVSGVTWAGLALPLTATLVGALFTAVGANRLQPRLTTLLGATALLAGLGCGLWLFFKGHAPWAAVGACTCGAFSCYWLRRLLPSA